MKRKRFRIEQIVAVRKQAELGTPVADLIRHLGIAEQTFSRWKRRYAGLESEQVREFTPLQEEHAKRKRVGADVSRDKVLLQDVLANTWYGPHRSGSWCDIWAPRIHSVHDGRAARSAMRGPPITIGVIAILAPCSGSGSGRWPRRGSGTATVRFACCSIGKGGPWARSPCTASTGKKA